MEFSQSTSDGRPPRSRAGFTLIEIVICMALFAVGFAAVAAMMPAGIMMERDLRGTADAAICGRNALEIMKGKGVHTLTCEFTTRAPGCVPGTLLNVNTRLFSKVIDAAHDLEAAATWRSRYKADFPGSSEYSQLSSEDGKLKEFWNTNADARIFAEYANVASRQFFNAWNGGALGQDYAYNTSTAAYGRMCLNDINPAASSGNTDRTHWPMGRIHVLKNRNPLPYSQLDFSYPSSILDLAARTQVSTVLYCNLAQKGCSYDLRFASPDANDWKLIAVTTSMSQGSEWPEQVEGNVVNPVNTTDAYPTGDPDLFTSPGRWLLSNSFASMRPKSIQNCGDTGAISFYATAQESWIRGRCDFVAMNEYQLRATSAGNTISEGWNWLGVSSYVASPVRDADGKYKLPTPVSVNALVYDKGKDLLLLRYPQVFARAPQAGNARVAAFRGKYPWVDRRLRIGDAFVTRKGGYLLRVRDILDPVAESATAPYGPVDWSDGSYQIVRVTPSLATLPFSGNATASLRNSSNPHGSPGAAAPDMGVASNPEWGNPYLDAVLVAPPPVAGGPSPWAATAQLHCGGSEGAVPQSYSNQNPFRNWANTAE